MGKGPVYRAKMLLFWGLVVFLGFSLFVAIATAEPYI